MQRSGGQLSERLASPGIMGDQVKIPLKYHGTMATRDVREHHSERCQLPGCTVLQPGWKTFLEHPATSRPASVQCARLKKKHRSDVQLFERLASL